MWLVLREGSSPEATNKWINAFGVAREKVIINGVSDLGCKRAENAPAALEMARMEGATRTLQADARLHRVSEALDLCTKDNEKWDLLIASRHKKRGWNGFFSFLSRVENWIVAGVLGTDVRDSTSTLRLWGHEALGAFQGEGTTPDHLLALESLFFVEQSGLRVKEIPFPALGTSRIGPIFFLETILYSCLLRWGKPRGTALEAFRFLLVGASGYFLNLLVFALLISLSLLPLLSACLAFIVSASYSFFWSKTWTFRSLGSPSGEGMKFLTIAVVALSANLLVLEVMLQFVPKVPAQAIGIACATPINFLGNKLWTFRRKSPSSKKSPPAP